MFKVENILKGSLVSIPSPSPFENKKFVDNAQQCFAFTPQVNFPANNLNITEGEGDGIKYRLPF
jgi:hypothetical protein